MKLTFDLLPIIGVVISILAWYVPGFKTWYEALVSQKKQLFMMGLLFVVAVVTSALSYFGVIHVYGGSTWQAFVWPPIVDFVIAVIANSGTYKATNYLLGKGN